MVKTSRPRRAVISERSWQNSTSHTMLLIQLTNYKWKIYFILLAGSHFAGKCSSSLPCVCYNYVYRLELDAQRQIQAQQTMEGSHQQKAWVVHSFCQGNAIHTQTPTRKTLNRLKTSASATQPILTLCRLIHIDQRQCLSLHQNCPLQVWHLLYRYILKTSPHATQSDLLALGIVNIY